MLPERNRWAWLAGCIALLGVVVPVRAQQIDQEGFEGPDSTWRRSDSDTQYRVLSHRRTRELAHGGRGCEEIRYAGSNGTFIHFSHAAGPARVISELIPSVWVRSDRPGVQLLARIVLPRTIDPRTRQPVTTLVQGSTLTQAGSWQQLQVTGISQAVTRQVRVLRNQIGPDVDPREAFLDQLVLNVYSGAGASTVWIDDLEIAGTVGGSSTLANPIMLTAATDATVAAPSPYGEVRLQGTMLLVSGRPMLPRIVDHRGEPLSYLQQLGFNVVRVAAVPSNELLQEATRLGLWLIAPPPTAEEIAAQGFQQPFEPVLAWDLGSGLTGVELEPTRQWAQRVQSRDPRSGRPLVGNAQSELRAYSRILDILVIGRSPIGTGLDLKDYAAWCAGQPRLARPGTPVWIRIQTELDAQLLGQWAALNGSQPQTACVDDQQLRALVRYGMSAGGRGFVFESSRALNSSDPATRRRALGLELVNLELMLAEPWAAGGSFVTSATSSDTQELGFALQTERARLLLPMRSQMSDQMVPSWHTGDTRSFVVPGVPESNDAHELTPAGLQVLRHKRVTGGIRVQQDHAIGPSMILLTSDPAVVGSLTRQAEAVRKRAAEASHELAKLKFELVEAVDKQLTPRQLGQVPTDAALKTARSNLQQCTTKLAAGDLVDAYRHAHLALAGLGLIERAHWQQSIKMWPSLVASPFAVHFNTLPQHFALADAIRASQVVPVPLPGGDFEDLNQMLQGGWRHVQHPVPGVTSLVELSPTDPYGGKFSLRMAATADDEQNPTEVVETPPVWVRTPAIPVRAGQLVQIHGWIHVPQPVKGSVDGMLIFESLGGPALAERIVYTKGWQEFTLYRVGTEAGSVSITFALTGLGEAWIDDVSVDPLQTARSGSP